MQVKIKIYFGQLFDLRTILLGSNASIHCNDDNNYKCAYLVEGSKASAQTGGLDHPDKGVDPGRCPRSGLESQ